MKTKVGSVLMSMLLLTACESIDEGSISKIELDGEGYHLLFFSNEQYIELEENYYDVLLDLKKEFPEEMGNLYLVQSSKRNSIKRYGVDTYPTLIMIKEEKTLARIEGKQNKKEMLNKLTSVMK
jgi:hypothetical protein